MARRPDHEPHLLPSVFDRLLDDRPDVTSEPVASRSQNLRALKKAVARDLESLLNTRQEALDPLPEGLTELPRSLLTYGLPDFTSFNLAATDDRMRVRRCLEEAVTTFEPRLARVRVAIEPARPHERVLRFRIDALLRTDPSPEPVMFDMVLQLNTQAYVVQGGD
jgi:type VI secretion system protein ImpF